MMFVIEEVKDENQKRQLSLRFWRICQNGLESQKAHKPI